MGRLLSGLALLIFLMACGEKLPEGVVSKKALPALLVDVHLLDGQLAAYPIDSARMLIASSYEALFKKHGIDSGQFHKTIEYYSNRPTEFREIYTIVNDQIQEYLGVEQAIMAEKYRQEQIVDSLFAVRWRDSLAQVAKDSADFILKRHLLLNHHTDSTIDKPIPVTFDKYANWFMENFKLEKLFMHQLKVDSIGRLDSIPVGPQEKFLESPEPSSIDRPIDFQVPKKLEELKQF